MLALQRFYCVVAVPWDHRCISGKRLQGDWYSNYVSIFDCICVCVCARVCTHFCMCICVSPCVYIYTHICLVRTLNSIHMNAIMFKEYIGALTRSEYSVWLRISFAKSQCLENWLEIYCAHTSTMLLLVIQNLHWLMHNLWCVLLYILGK